MFLPFLRYSTGSKLNTYSALIQNFYSQETSPHQAIHVAVNTGVEEGQEPGVKAFIRYDFLLIPPGPSHLTSMFPAQLVLLWVYSPNPKTVSLFRSPWSYASTMPREVDVRYFHTLLSREAIANTSYQWTSL